MSKKPKRLKNLNSTTNLKRPKLRFSPAAWAKFLFLRDAGPTEIAAFGISSANDPLLVERVELVPQDSTPTSVSLTDDGVADFIDSKIDAGLEISSCLRIWLHTHPANCALPSLIDEKTFARVFGSCNWSVMAILARGGRSYARLQFGVGPAGAMRINMDVDYACPFEASDQLAWLDEYKTCVRHAIPKHAGTLHRRLFGRAMDQFDPNVQDEWELDCEHYF